MDETQSGNHPPPADNTHTRRRRAMQALARACGAGYTSNGIEESTNQAIVCPVPRDPAGADTAPPWMRRLHSAFDTLARRWDKAPRRPDRSQPGSDAHVLAHSTGDEANLVVIYVGYNPALSTSIFQALTRAARFAAACKLKTLGVMNPTSMDANLSAEEIRTCLVQMTASGVRVTLHESAAHGW